MPERIAVSVVLALAQRQHVVELELEAGANAQLALERSGLLRLLAPGEGTPTLAVRHRPCAPEAPLYDGDRVEILRPLRVEPMQARRLRAAGRLRRAQGGDES